jgi:hypothetical protein
MKKKILGMCVRILLTTTNVLTVESLKNNAIDSTIPSPPLPSMIANWTKETKLVGSDGTQEKYFGGSVSLYDDHVLIGTPGDQDNRCYAGSTYVFTKNQSPNPPTIDGLTIGKMKVVYNFTVVTTDPDGDNVHYFIDWGDGNYTDWLGPYSSGQTVNVSHSWNIFGKFEMKIKAKDSNNQESIWSAPFNIYISRNYSSVILFGVFLDYEEYSASSLGVVIPFFGFYMQCNPFDFRLFAPNMPPMVGIIFDTSTKKGAVLPGSMPTTYGYLGVIVGKFDAVAIQWLA